MVWVLLGALGNYVAAEFGLSPAQKGLMTALPLLAGSFLRIVLGILSDRVGAKNAGTFGLLATLAPLLCGWLWADSIAEVYLVGLLLGVAGGSFAVALPIASRWYPAEYQGLAMGIAGAGTSGTVLATLLAPRLAELCGWHAVFGLAIWPVTVVFMVFITCAKEAPGSGKRQGAADFFRLMRQRDTYLFSLFYAVTFGGFVGLASFLSIYLHDQFGVSRIRAGDLASICVISGSLLRPLGGFLADRLGGIRMLMRLYGAAVLLAIAAAQLPPLMVTVPLFFLLMACLGIGNGCVFQLVPQRFRQEVGVATGILGAAGGLGGFLLPLALGGLKQWFGSYKFGLLAFAGVAALALATLVVVRRGWIGNWIGAHGRVQHTAPPAPVGASPEPVRWQYPSQVLDV